MLLEKQSPTARPEEPPSSGGVSKGARREFVCKAGSQGCGVIDATHAGVSHAGVAHTTVQWHPYKYPSFSLETWQKLLASQTSTRDPLAIALRRKAQTEGPGVAEGTMVAAGDGWRVIDVVCTSGPRDRPFEERHAWASVSLVLSGTFVYRSDHVASLMSPGALLLGNAGHTFECSHPHGEGDRCLSFQFDPELFARLAHDAGAARDAFDLDRLPPLRALAPLTARAQLAVARRDSFEEIALEMAGAVVQAASRTRRDAPAATPDPARIARVLRQMESRSVEPQPLAELARLAGLSRYHFLRTFKGVTGITPHQWLLRARLRDAAQRLVTSRDAVTDIALDVGFDDLSNFIRSFRAEFGVSPRRYRGRAAGAE
jgi:AraC family transcriptional regulator